MHKKVLAGSVLAVSAFALVACSSSGGSTSGGSTPSTTQATGGTTTQATTPAATSTSRSGTFAGLNGKHVAGTVEVSASSVVLSGFSSDMGPDLHVYLANGSDEAAVAAGKEIGKLATGSSQTFSISGVDTSGYTTVVIHCDKAKASFGAAPLS